jgi:hypothetical protein
MALAQVADANIYRQHETPVAGRVAQGHLAMPQVHPAIAFPLRAGHSRNSHLIADTRLRGQIELPFFQSVLEYIYRFITHA